MTDFAKLHKAFDEAGHDLYEVGGCVRDRLLGVTPNDTDFATSALPEETMEILTNAGYKHYPLGIEFGTIQTMVGEDKVEITTYRSSESYVKGDRKPAVVFGSSIEEDLKRRDFSINAMAWCDGKLVDPFGGKADLENGVIRTPSDPAISFTDDPLRMLRGCRFIARGLGQWHFNTHNAIYNFKGLVKDLSGERIFEEVTKLLLTPKPSKGLRAMEETGLLKELFPELQVVADFKNDPGKYHHLLVWDHTLLVVDNGYKNEPVMWATLFHDISKPECWTKKDGNVHFYQHDKRGSEVWSLVAKRLKCSNKFSNDVCQLIYEHQNLRGNMGIKGIRRLIHRLGDGIENQFRLAYADIVGHKPNLVKSSLDDLNGLKRRVDEMLAGPEPVTNKLPRGTGDIVCEVLKISPGPKLGKTMKILQQMMVDGDLKFGEDSWKQDIKDTLAKII